MADDPICARDDGCEAPVHLALKELDGVHRMVLDLFHRAVWMEMIAPNGRIIKRNIDWAQTELVARNNRYPWTPKVSKLLEICERVILVQQNHSLQLESESEKDGE